MDLPFTLNINNKPNFFAEKIWKGLLKYGLATNSDCEHCQSIYERATGLKWNNNEVILPKIHTIRRGQRWLAEMPLALATEELNGNMFSFAPQINCLAIQEIKILQTPIFEVLINGKALNEASLKLLAINDGFNDLDDFKNYFKSDFRGQIVHWTDFLYE